MSRCLREGAGAGARGIKTEGPTSERTAASCPEEDSEEGTIPAWGGRTSKMTN